MAENPLTDDDVFEKVVDIAQAAQQAMESAARATQKASYVEELAVQARHEADQLKQLSASLAATAASSAKVALDIAKYETVKEAYQAQPALYSNKLDYDSFIDVLTIGRRFKDNLPDDELALADGAHARRKCQRNQVDSSGLDDLESKLLRQCSSGTSPGTTPVPAHKNVTSSCTRGSSSEIEKETPTTLSNSATRLKILKDPLQEKFPASSNAIDQREILAATFESTGNYSAFHVYCRVVLFGSCVRIN